MIKYAQNILLRKINFKDSLFFNIHIQKYILNIYKLDFKIIE
jgi:hypothetical protein